jgi:polyhydroxyalkanoate synthesis regulator phasin
MLKELLYTGIGASLLLKEKVELELSELEKNGKIKTDDAKSFLESIKTKGQEEDQKIKEHLKTTLKEIIDELGLATKEDIAQLKQEIKQEIKQEQK